MTERAEGERGASNEAEIHDTSRVDAFMAARRHSMLMHAVWKPMLAGAAGAALVVAAVYVTLPKLSLREVVVDHVVQRDVPVDHVVPKDVTVPNIVPRDVSVPNVVSHDVQVDRVVPRDVPVDIPRIVPHDVQVDHVVPHEVEVDIPRVVEAAPLTPAERSFVDRPEYQNAPYHGRIVLSRGGGALSFADGKDFFPAHWDFTSSRAVLDPGQAFDADIFVGEFGMCRQDQDGRLWSCVALHHGRETPITYKRGRPA
jgi:hypothetical protein